MESKYMGIIVQRQDGKILLYDESYYIKIKVTEGDDIHSVIEKKLIEELDIKLFKLKREYDEIKLYKNNSPFQKNNDIDKMYLVDVCIYHDNYDFRTKSEIYECLYNCPQKKFYEKYFIRYENYKELLQCNFVSIIMVLSTIIIAGNLTIPKNRLLEMLIYIFILCLIGFYIFIIPKITIKILDYIINEKIIRYSNISSITIGVLSLIIIFITN